MQAKQVQAVICEMQEPLKKELIEGIAILKINVAQFDIDFELNGPMVEEIPAEEASERYMFHYYLIVLIFVLRLY